MPAPPLIKPKPATKLLLSIFTAYSPVIPFMAVVLVDMLVEKLPTVELRVVTVEVRPLTVVLTVFISFSITEILFISVVRVVVSSLEVMAPVSVVRSASTSAAV